MSDLHKKLRLSEGTTIVVLNAPEDYTRTMGKLPRGVSTTDKIGRGRHDFIHLFVKNKAELEKEIFKACGALAPDGLIWIMYPKGRSGIQTDLTRDRGWECLEKLKMQWLSLISFNDDWSAFLMKNAPPKAPSRASSDYHAISAEWVDLKKKIVKVPDDLAVAMKKDQKAQGLFNALSFTDRKEYVLWVVGAKREETRAERVKGTVRKLHAGLKNPAGR